MNCPACSPISHGIWAYDTILNNIDIGVVILDPAQESVCYRNPASHEILRDQSSPVSFKELCLLFPDIPFDASETPHPHNKTIRHGNRLLEYSVFNTTGTHMSIFIRNITEKARLESIAQAVNAMDNIGYIFSGIRHEIGNPLNSIKMTMSVLRNNIDTFSKENILAYIDRSLTEIHRMEFLLKSLKNFSMFENLEIKDVDLVQFLVRFLELAKRDFEKKGLRVRSLAPAHPVWAKIDQRALHQSLLNIMTNASDALENRTHPEILISVQKRENLVWLVVRDNGAGMSSEQMAHLFQPFNTTKNHGNGLGLVITRKLLAKMNSNIEIQSHENIGTTVVITLPLGTPEFGVVPQQLSTE